MNGFRGEYPIARIDYQDATAPNVMKPVFAMVSARGAAVQCKLEVKDGKAILLLDSDISLGGGEYMDIVVA